LSMPLLEPMVGSSSGFFLRSPTLVVEAGGMFQAARFLWNATRGSRLRPWRSPYLRWRYETYTGKPAGEVRLADFFHLARAERWQLLRFLAWVGEMKGYAKASE